MFLLHRNEGGIGKYIPDAREIVSFTHSMQFLGHLQILQKNLCYFYEKCEICGKVQAFKLFSREFANLRVFLRKFCDHLKTPSRKSVDKYHVWYITSRAFCGANNLYFADENFSPPGPDYLIY